MVLKVAVIGAGAAGLASVKCCLEEGLEPVCFERADSVGGLWHFTEEPKEGQASIYRSTTTNGSKIFLNFSDFPYPDDFPNFLPHFKVQEYLEMYARHFKLLPYIRLKQEVLSVRQEDSLGQWKVNIKELDSGAVREHTFDAVMVCAGLHKKKNLPQYPGQETFEGEIFHAHEYKDGAPFRGKKVLSVGFGDCAVEAAVECSRLNPKAYLSTRHGNWVIPRTGLGGLPYDFMLYRRSQAFWMRFRSLGSINDQIEGFCSSRLDHGTYNIKPDWRFTQSQPLINDDLASRVLMGYLELRPAIARIGPSTVEFVDGSVLEDVDAIIFGTGYQASFPFIDERIPMKTGYHINLYKWVFPPSVSQNTLAMIGCVRVIGGHFPTFELQARWATRVFTQQAHLPSRATMEEKIARQHAQQDAAFLSNPRHCVTLGWMAYNDDLAAMVGCQPSMVSLLLRDPALARQVWYGPCVPAHYRLQGPSPWKGARDVIMNLDHTIRQPFKTRRMAGEASSSAAGGAAAWLWLSSLVAAAAGGLLTWSYMHKALPGLTGLMREA